MAQNPTTKPRFTQPADNRRPYKSHRYEVWSPKLSRRITFFDELRLDAWVLLEAEPAITAFCERPLVFKGEKRGLVVDFWVNRNGVEELLILRSADNQEQARPVHPALSTFAEADKITIRVLNDTDIRANSALLSNWKAILHYLVANERLVSSDLKQRTLREFAVSSGRTLGELEESLIDEDPVLVRTAVFSLLRKGDIRSPDVAITALSRATGFMVS